MSGNSLNTALNLLNLINTNSVSSKVDALSSATATGLRDQLAAQQRQQGIESSREAVFQLREQAKRATENLLADPKNAYLAAIVAGQAVEEFDTAAFPDVADKELLTETRTIIDALAGQAAEACGEQVADRIRRHVTASKRAEGLRLYGANKKAYEILSANAAAKMPGNKQWAILFGSYVAATLVLAFIAFASGFKAIALFFGLFGQAAGALLYFVGIPMIVAIVTYRWFKKNNTAAWDAARQAYTDVLGVPLDLTTYEKMKFRVETAMPAIYGPYIADALNDPAERVLDKAENAKMESQVTGEVFDTPN
jgi:hypothetical protein